MELIIVFGASGDLAYKKTYPALYGLFKKKLLPPDTKIVGFARSALSDREFHDRISLKVDMSQEFLDICSYIQGAYDNQDSFKFLAKYISQWSIKNLMFYMALPPSVFIQASHNIRDFLYQSRGKNRLVIEKPFGKDLISAKQLSAALSEKWLESEIYRIDHYLGKEMVKNLLIMRFANVFFSAVWNSHYISNIQITFKESIGTQGRGGYFDEFGIIRDVVQNHLLQILTIVAMERPVSKNADDVRDEKVKVLKSIEPISLNHTILGQYMGSIDGKEPGYLDDKTVPQGSSTPTFATVVLYCNNERWTGNLTLILIIGVPFIIKAGKALNESKAEVRIQFKEVPGDFFPGISRNELVVRIQPQESVYLKFMNKKPGLSSTPVISELDLTYKNRYADHDIPEAYEVLILDALNGDKSNFVRDDELEEAWKIFTPLLHEIEAKKIKPIPYIFGSRGPQEATDLIKNLGYMRQEDYTWAISPAPRM